MVKLANGAELLNAQYSDINYVILAKWNNQYVTARMHNLSDKEWFWGHYFPKTEDGLNRAVAHFFLRTGQKS